MDGTVTTPRRTPPRRGRPRSEHADVAIRLAALSMLPEHGFRALSMEAVAARAGVSKATLYRRYKSKEDLIADVLRAIPNDSSTPDLGSVRDELLAVLRRKLSAVRWVPDAPRVVARLLGDAASDAKLQALINETLIAPDRRIIRLVLERGIARGELRNDLDVDLATDILYGALIYRLVLSGEGLAAGRTSHLKKLLDTILQGFASNQRRRHR